MSGIEHAYCYQEEEILEEKESIITTAKLVVVGLMKETAETVVHNMMMGLCRGVVDYGESDHQHAGGKEVFMAHQNIATGFLVSIVVTHAALIAGLHGVRGIAEQCGVCRYEVPDEVGSLYEVDYLQCEYYDKDYDYLNTESDKTQSIQV